jgi:hypothetical protein
MSTEKPKRPYVRTVKVYVVSHPDHMDRLIRAISAAEAIRYASSGYEAKLATQDDIIALMGGGTPVETTVAASNVPGVDDDGMPAGLTD